MHPISPSSSKALRVAKAALFPLLLAQALYVRHKALDLPEAEGVREGEALPPTQRLRLMAPLRVLLVGDSSAAGVGVEHQRHALATQLALSLADELGRPVHWQLIARTGHTSIEALAHAREEGPQVFKADILVSVLGVNDVVRQIPVSRTLEQLEHLNDWARETAGVRYWLHSGVPPMHQFPLLPPPLKWVLGSQAELLNQQLQYRLGDQRDRALRRIPAALRCDASKGLMARDGFHPSAAGYALWGQALGQFLARRWMRLERRA
ncbi:MAG: SGNH/GDSL hydrolase family protein [Burkholderiales bacterium]